MDKEKVLSYVSRLNCYGGKQKPAVTILRLIPEHKMYAGPFTGDAEVYFDKAPSKAEAINDTGGEPVNFYEVPGGTSRLYGRRFESVRAAGKRDSARR